MTLPVSENWIAEYNNLRCKRDYIYDSGWVFNESTMYRYYYINSYGNVPVTIYRWNYTNVYSGLNSDGYTYSTGNCTYSDNGDMGSWNHECYLKRTKPMVEYKSFSSF